MVDFYRRFLPNAARVQAVLRGMLTGPLTNGSTTLTWIPLLAHPINEDPAASEYRFRGSETIERSIFFEDSSCPYSRYWGFIILWCHEVLTCRRNSGTSHPGLKATQQLMTDRLVWPSIRRDCWDLSSGTRLLPTRWDEIHLDLVLHIYTSLISLNHY